MLTLYHQDDHFICESIQFKFMSCKRGLAHDSQKEHCLCDTNYIVMFRIMTIILYRVVGMMEHVQILRCNRFDVGDYSSFMCSDYSGGCGLLWAMSLR